MEVGLLAMSLRKRERSLEKDRPEKSMPRHFLSLGLTEKQSTTREIIWIRQLSREEDCHKASRYDPNES